MRNNDALKKMAATGKTPEQFWIEAREGEKSWILICGAGQRKVDDLCREQARLAAELEFINELPYHVEREAEVEDLGEEEKLALQRASIAFQDLDKELNNLRLFTRFRMKLQIKLATSYLAKIARGERLNEREAWVKARFLPHTKEEYVVNDIAWGMEGRFELRDLSLDDSSSVRARIDESPTLSRDERWLGPFAEQ